MDALTHQTVLQGYIILIISCLITYNKKFVFHLQKTNYMWIINVGLIMTFNS